MSVRDVILQAIRANWIKNDTSPVSETDAILAALAEAGFVLMKADAVTKHKAWCPALSQCECEGSE